MADAPDSPSPFAMLLAETGTGAAPEPRHQPARTREPGAVAALRNHGQRGEAMRTEHSQRPQWRDDDGAVDAPPEATETTETAEADPAEATTAAPSEEQQAADQSEAVATEQALDMTAAPAQPGDDTGDPVMGQPAAVDPALAVAAAVAPSPAPEQAAVTETPSQPQAAIAAVPAATEAAADAPAPESSIAAAASAGPAPTTTLDAGGGTTEPAPTLGAQSPQTAEAPPTPEAPAAAPAAPSHQRSAAHAKPAIAAAATTDTEIPAEPGSDAAAPAAPGRPQHAETESSSQREAHAQTHASAPQDAPETNERPQTASTVSEFVQANHPTPDSSQGAHLQTGREFGQSVAATAQAAHHADASNPLVSAPVPLESLAVEIASRAQAGRSRFEIRLDPPELGRIDVRLDIDRSGNVTSRLVVDKAETLDALRRDAYQLERALQDAGLKTSDSALQFSLRDHSSAQRDDRNGSDGTRVLVADPERPAAEGAPLAYGLTLRGRSGIDIRV